VSGRAPSARSFEDRPVGAANGVWGNAVNSGEGKKILGKAYDPICGVRVDGGAEGVPSSEYKKRRYFFCSEKCRQEFERAAERIRMQEAARAGALFTQGKVRWGLA
jgi:YHS domain-containing protein